MDALKQKLAAFQQSTVGLFLKKFLDDQGTNLASLLAWGMLSTLLPLLLGVLGLSGLILRDPQRLDQVYGMLVALVPGQTSDVLGTALENMRHQAAGTVGIVGIVLLLYNGSQFFSNMASVFDQAFHVEDRNMVLQHVVAIVMLLVFTVLLVVSLAALGIGSFFEALQLGWPIGPVLARVLSWSVSIVSTIVTFILLYRILPNKPQTFAQVLPGALLSTVLFLLTLLLFPLYVNVFPPNQAYAVFGVFLLFTFFLYLMGIVFVLGVELNAFLQEPERSVALAEAQARAQHGKAEYEQQGGGVQAHATGGSRDMGGGSDANQGRRGALGTLPKAQPAEPAESASPRSEPARPGIGGRIVGAVGLIVAALLIRGRTQPQHRAH